MKTSDAGRAAIRKEEGEKLTAYLDTANPPRLTIGCGHTSAAGPPTVTKGMKITAAQSDAILAQDLAGVEADINRLVKVPINQAQFDALVSLVFNIGSTKFAKSSVLTKLNASDYAGAADAILLYKMAGGKPQLLARRQRERAMFLSGAPASSPPVSTPAVNTTTIEVVQRKLIELGYTEVGSVDGKLGKLTQTAILAFRNENGLPVSSDIDDALLTALDTAKPRSLARNDATATDVRAAVPEAQSAYVTKVTGAIGAGGLGISALGDVGSKVDTVRGYISPWKDMFGDIPSWAWLAAAAAVFVGIFLVARHGEKKSVDAFQAGARR